jgi:23S rRNA (guanosine2251-2'-O)-methyltransferase
MPRSFFTCFKGGVMMQQERDGSMEKGRRFEGIYLRIESAFEVIRAGRRNGEPGVFERVGRADPRLKETGSLLHRNNIPVEWVEKGRCGICRRAKKNQGVVLKCSAYPYVPFEELLAAERIMLLDNVEDPHNVGASCAVRRFRIQACGAPMKNVPDIYPSSVKVSAGATISADQQGIQCHTVCEAVEGIGFSVAALVWFRNGDVRERHPKFPGVLALVIGGEDKGVGQFILNSPITCWPSSSPAASIP